MDEILFPITNTSFRPDEASSAAARKPQAFQEEMAWPPVLVLQGCSSEFDSSGKLDAKFRGQGVTKTAPMFTPSFCGQAVLCFGESNGSLLAEAYEKGGVKYVETEDAGMAVGLKETNATPIMLAAQHGKMDMIKLLLAKGANINCVMTNGITPLFLAVQGPNLETAHVFLDAGRGAWWFMMPSTSSEAY